MRFIPRGARSPSYVHSVVSYFSTFFFATLDGSPYAVRTEAIVDSPGVIVPHPAATAAPHQDRTRNATSAALMTPSRPSVPQRGAVAARVRPAHQRAVAHDHAVGV